MKKIKPKTIKFKDYPDFRPNLTPSQIFQLGSFGGTYWRPIKSRITKKKYQNVYLNFPKKWWKGLQDKELVTRFEDYDKDINRYKVKVGTTLEFWEDKGWITKYDPYGWVMWYSNFYNGRRCPDDERQISRWKGIARFKHNLINQILKSKTKNINDPKISPKIRQVLQHWGYQLTKKDFNLIAKTKKKSIKKKITKKTKKKL